MFQPHDVVEVSLRRIRHDVDKVHTYASWYEASIVEQAKGGKWKVALRRIGAGGVAEPLFLAGRPADETAQLQQLQSATPQGYVDFNVDWQRNTITMEGETINIPDIWINDILDL